MTDLKVVNQFHIIKRNIKSIKKIKNNKISIVSETIQIKKIYYKKNKEIKLI